MAIKTAGHQDDGFIYWPLMGDEFSGPQVVEELRPCIDGSGYGTVWYRQTENTFVVDGRGEVIHRSNGLGWVPRYTCIMVGYYRIDFIFIADDGKQMPGMLATPQLSDHPLTAEWIAECLCVEEARFMEDGGPPCG